MLIEDYGLVEDLRAAPSSAATVRWTGCAFPADSASCFSALLGDERHGRWLVAPADEVLTTTRRYRPGTLVLDTDFETAEGAVRVTDFMPPRGDGPPRFMRIVHGLRGRRRMLELVLRPDYGSIALDRAGRRWRDHAGADAFRLSTPLAVSLEHGRATAEFDAIEGARERFADWHPAHLETPPVEDADSALARTETWWQDWTSRSQYEGIPRRGAGGLIVLKAMTYETTGALIAAPTTSLPEDIGGLRNWDYRYCWLRDSVLALQALIAAGYGDEAMAFRDFLLHTATGDPSKLQIMYAIAGERRLTEFELPELPGYEGLGPVRVGNAASEQFQLDVYGEVINVAYLGVQLRGQVEPRLWPRWRTAIEYVETIWREPDDGIWESRGPRRHYYSKVMAWVVFDRAVRLPNSSTSSRRWSGGAHPRRDPPGDLRPGV